MVMAFYLSIFFTPIFPICGNTTIDALISITVSSCCGKVVWSEVGVQ